MKSAGKGSKGNIEMLDEDTNSEDNIQEANLGLLVTLSSGEEPSPNSNEDDEVISERFYID